MLNFLNMKKKVLLLFSVALCTVLMAQQRYVMVIHGGAGYVDRKTLSPESEKAYREKLTEALQKGYKEIQAGKTAVDAVAAAIVVLEDSPLFNAGKGAVFTHDGVNELDASIMYGKDKSAGAIAGVRTVKNPIKAAIAVMQKSEHVMLSGRGAEQFAELQQLEIVPNEYFRTDSRWNSLQRVIKEEQNKSVNRSAFQQSLDADKKFGTVGAVALDKARNIAAGTSTGGMTNKRYGRIGDSPIIGAGTYANGQVGVSATGHGEYFIRSTAARTLAAKMEYQGKNVQTAATETIDEIGKLGGDGGIIALDKDGHVAMPFNTSGMYRGTITDKGVVEISIFK